MAFGAISSLTESVGSGAGGGSSTTTASSVDGGGNVNSDGSVTVDGKLTVFTGGSGNYMGKASDVATYSYGDCFDYTSEEENNRIYMGKIINSITDEALICFAFLSFLAQSNVSWLAVKYLQERLGLALGLNQIISFKI